MIATSNSNAPGGLSPQKKKINAKEFVAAFLEKPDDFHLMAKYGITVRQLKQIYSALLEKGLLSDFEYGQRDNKAPELAEEQQFHLSASATVRLVEQPSEVLTERIAQSGYCFDQGLRDAISESLEEKKRRVGRRMEPVSHKAETIDRCPRCGKPKDPSSPAECPYCGVVFEKA